MPQARVLLTDYRCLSTAHSMKEPHTIENHNDTICHQSSMNRQLSSPELFIQGYFHQMSRR